MRLLITGGRTETLTKMGIDPGAVYVKLVRTLNEISAGGKRELVIIHGGSPGGGVDAMANQWADRSHTTKEVYPASPDEVRRVGGVAYNMRNTEMLERGKPDVCLAFPGGGGTADMVAKCRAANVRVVEVTV